MKRSREGAPAPRGEGEGRDERESLDAAAHWKELFGRLADRLVHEIRNPLNGAMVNLQVVCARAARPGQDAAALEPFARSAASELERVVSLLESLFAIMRPPRAGEDIASVLRSLATLYGAALERLGGTLTVDTAAAEGDGGGASLARTTMDPEILRLAVAAALDAATSERGDAHAELRATEGEVRLHLRRGDGLRALQPEMVHLLATAGISAEVHSQEHVLHFPAPSAGG